MLSYLKPEKCILMMDGVTEKFFIQSIDDESITKQEVSGITWNDQESGFMVSFITLTADYRYLIVVGIPCNDYGNSTATRYDIYVMDLKSGQWKFRRCGVDIARDDWHHFAASRKWYEAEIAISGYIRELYVSKDKNVLIIPMEIQNVIGNYFGVQEFVHFIGGCQEAGGHFAISVDDILLSRMD